MPIESASTGSAETSVAIGAIDVPPPPELPAVPPPEVDPDAEKRRENDCDRGIVFCNPPIPLWRAGTPTAWERRGDLMISEISEIEIDDATGYSGIRCVFEGMDLTCELVQFGSQSTIGVHGTVPPPGTRVRILGEKPIPPRAE
jgi:hypothetical protein